MSAFDDISRAGEDLIFAVQRYTRTEGAARPVGNPALIGRPDPLVHRVAGRSDPDR